MKTLITLFAIVLTIGSTQANEETNKDLLAHYLYSPNEEKTLITNCPIKGTSDRPHHCFSNSGHTSITFGLYPLVAHHRVFEKHCGGEDKECYTKSIVKKCMGDPINLIPMTEREYGLMQKLVPGYPLGNKSFLLEAAPRYFFSVEGNTFIPAPEDRGLIARIYLYMAKVNCIDVTPVESSLYEMWSSTMPPKENEILKGLLFGTKIPPLEYKSQSHNVTCVVGRKITSCTDNASGDTYLYNNSFKLGV